MVKWGQIKKMKGSEDSIEAWVWKAKRKKINGGKYKKSSRRVNNHIRGTF